MTVSSIEPRMAQCRTISVALCGTNQYVTPCHGRECINCHLFWASLYFVYHFLFIPPPPPFFLSIHANFSVAATSTQISLYSISVSSLFILLLFTLLFFFSFSWILSAPCNETWRESGNLLVMQCACLHIFLAASYLGRFVRSLRYRLIISKNRWLRFLNSTFQFRARAEATQNAYIGTFVTYW